MYTLRRQDAGEENQLEDSTRECQFEVATQSSYMEVMY